MSTIKIKMALGMEEFTEILTKEFPNSKIKLTELIKDGDHYQLEISSPEFESLSLLQSHRLINERLKEYIGTKVHALTIKSINII